MTEQCRRIQAYLADYLEQNLEPSECAEVSAHLAVCEVCRQEYQRLEQVPHLLQQWAPTVPTDALWQAIQSKIPRASASPRRWGYALIGSAAAVLTLIAIWQWGQPKPPPPITTQLRVQPFYRAHFDWAPHSEAVNLHLSLASGGL